MESKDELKEIDLKIRTLYYSDDIIKDVVITFSDISLDEKLYENVSVCDISYKPSTGPKPFRIRFDKLDGFIRLHGGEFRYLVLFNHGLFDKICCKIKYLISEKVVLQIVLIIILEKSELIHIIIYQMKNIEFS